MKTIAQSLLLIAILSLTGTRAYANSKSCEVALLPIANELVNEAKRFDIVTVFAMKGYNAVVVENFEAAKGMNLVADASVDCTSTYYGMMGKTTLRLIDNQNNQIISRITTPAVMDLYNCKIELIKAISLLPDCNQ